LTDIKLNDLLQDRSAELKVIALASTRGDPSHHARRGELIGNEHRRVDERDSFSLKLVGKSREKRRVSSIMPDATVPKTQRTPIGQVPDDPEGIVRGSLGDAPDHDCFVHPGTAQHAQPGRDSRDARDLELIAQRGKGSVELLRQTDGTDAAPGAPHAFSDEKGQTTLSRDQADRRARSVRCV